MGRNSKKFEIDFKREFKRNSRRGGKRGFSQFAIMIWEEFQKGFEINLLWLCALPTPNKLKLETDSRTKHTPAINSI